MRLAVDTSLLVRVVTRDDDAQARVAFDLLAGAERVMISLPCLCELVWVLRSVYRYEPADIEIGVHSVVDPANVVTEDAAVEAGLKMLSLGGDFADGVIASAGAAMGAEVFVSFDRKAVMRLGRIGISARHATELA